jgi:NADPH:quinone reductase-like Zn-dependent oxidoreductase/3-oxoacyl-(acyl-carrier-protein) synthase
VTLSCGGSVCCGQINGFKTRTFNAQVQTVAVAMQRHLYAPIWREANTKQESASAKQPHVLAVGTGGICYAALTQDKFAQELLRSSYDLVVCTLTLQRRHDVLCPLFALSAALSLMKEQAASSLPSVWLLTAGVQTQSDAMAMQPCPAGAWGLSRVARQELQLDISCLDGQDGAHALSAVTGNMSAAGEPEIVARAGQHFVSRLQGAHPTFDGLFRMSFHARGALGNLFLESQTATTAAADGEVIMEVRAVGLNFRDVLNVLGEYPGDPGPPGLDCCGVVAVVGPSVNVTAGSAMLSVKGHAPLASMACVSALLMAPRPPSLTFEEASTLPTTWCTTHVAMTHRRMTAGSRILVHAASGGVGLHAGEYSRWLHGNARGTAGRPHKHRQLRFIGFGLLSSSRDGSAFARSTADTLRGHRISAVLNSLSSDFIAASFASLTEGACFAEIGKRSIWSAERHNAATHVTEYVPIALDADMDFNPVWMNGVLNLLSARAAATAATSLPLRSFDLEAQVELAFRVLQGGLNTGKVVIRIAPRSDRDLSGDGCHLITGGTGGLGLLTGRWLAQRCVPGLALASRSGALARDATTEWGLLSQTGADVRLERCDAAQPADLCRLVLICQQMQNHLHGLWHAAGTLSDALLTKQTPGSLCHVYGPKAHAAWTIHHACANFGLAVCTLFSSVAGTFYGMGQGNYGAANTCLDALSICRRGNGNAAAAVQWGPWAEVGMAARGQASERAKAAEKSSGWGRIGLDQGLAAMQTAVRPKGLAVLGVFQVAWDRYLGGGAVVPSYLSGYAPRKQTGGPLSASKAAASQEQGVSLESVLEMVSRTAGGSVDADAPLMEAGVDSLGAVELRNQLQAAVGHGTPLSSTVVLDHPTARQLALLLAPAGQSSAPAQDQTVFCAPMERGGARAIMASCSEALPAGVSSKAMAHHTSTNGTDLVSQIPAARWAIASHVSEAVTLRVRHGGFVHFAEGLDAAAFSVSPAEAAAMDPQQRLVLEYGYDSLFRAGMARAQLNGSLTGVFLGIEIVDFARILPNSPAGSSVFAATGTNISVASGRLSYTLGLHGPCASYATACSAALTAAHGAHRALQHGECSVALTAGIFLVLTPHVSTSFAVAGMTSTRGRCHTFDSRADGYSRGEACCTTALYCDGKEGALGVEGTAVRQDGRSASLTAPNGQAQQWLLRAGLTDACLAAAMLTVHEAHGTGTALGDPIEAGSLVGAVLSERDMAPLTVGGVKANIGHAEQAAGVTGLLKLVAGLQAGMMSPNAQLRSLNPMVRVSLQSVLCALPAQQHGVPTHEVRSGGVSSFGYSGTIAYAVLLQAIIDDSMAPSDPLLAYRRRAFPWFRNAAATASAMAAVRLQEERRWHYEIEWSPAPLPPPCTTLLELLIIGSVPNTPLNRGATITKQTKDVGEGFTLRGNRCHAAVLTTSLRQNPMARVSELTIMDAALRLLQAQALRRTMPVWLCTKGTQSSSEPGRHENAGLWGLARACRQEDATFPAWCVDVGAGAQGLATMIQHHTLRLSEGQVRGLNLTPSIEPEVKLHASEAYVARLVCPCGTSPRVFDVIFDSSCDLLDAHVLRKMEELDMEELLHANELDETLCQQWSQGALQKLHADLVLKWHHKLLYKWCAKQIPLDSYDSVTPEQVLAAHRSLAPDVELGKCCGPRFGDALDSSFPYQELLFPGGTMEKVQGIYEDSVVTWFYNNCVVAAVESVLAMLPKGRKVVIVEVGAGTGGTASNVLPVVKHVCERYVFTDVSDFFLRGARRRFAEYPFIAYELLNIDSDVRIQGYASHANDMLLSANCLHATPFMRNTLRNCEQLLSAGGFLVVNELQYTTCFLQITFGMTDGCELSNARTLGNNAPLT